MPGPDVELIDIWLSPGEEVSLSHQQLADAIGVSLQTFRQRIRNYGVDHYLTYYPGNIPSKTRRMGTRKQPGGVQHSRLSEIKTRRIKYLDPQLATDLVVGLIKASQRDFIKHNCQDSRSFLLNENGMLLWYIECIPKLDGPAFLQRMREWVRARERQLNGGG